MPKGRPSQTGKPKDYLLRIRLDEDERTVVEARAKQLGKGVSTHARDLLLADAAVAKTAKK